MCLPASPLLSSPSLASPPGENESRSIAPPEWILHWQAPPLPATSPATVHATLPSARDTPHTDSDWPTGLRLQHYWSPIGRGFSVMLRLAGLQGVLFLWDGCRGAQEDLCAHRDIPTNLSRAGRVPQHHSDASNRKWSQSFLHTLIVVAPKSQLSQRSFWHMNCHFMIVNFFSCCMLF